MRRPAETGHGRVEQVDFTAARLGRRPANRPGASGEPTRATPRRGGRIAPQDSTLAALAQLISERATPDTIERDIAGICDLLHRRCGWSVEHLARLRLAAESAHAMRRRDARPRLEPRTS